MIVGLFSILTGKRCPDGRNHSDAEAQPVFNRTGEWDSVFLGYSVRGPSQPANQRDLARSRHSNSAACSVYPARSRSSLPHVSRSFIAAGRLPLVSADRRQWTTSGLSPAGHITSQVQRRRQQLRLALEQSECPECWRWLRGAKRPGQRRAAALLRRRADGCGPAGWQWDGGICGAPSRCARTEPPDY